MIQRIQSVYLFFGALFLALIVVFSNAWMDAAAALHTLLPWVVYALSAVGGLIGFVAVFLYKDRKMQARIVTAAQWLDLALIIVLVAALGMFTFGSEQSAPPPSAMAYVVLLLPAGAYILFGLARRAVKKDIDLVRSMDRLR